MPGLIKIANVDGGLPPITLNSPTLSGTVTVSSLGTGVVHSSSTGVLTSTQIVTGDINNNAVTTDKIADSNVTTIKINDNAVTTVKIDSNAVTSAKINDNAITTVKIDSNAVTSAKINDNAITTAKIDSNAVTTAKINDNAIITSKIDSNAVTSAKLALDISYNGILKVVDCTVGSVNTQTANKGYVDKKVSDLVGLTAPASLDTLSEIATAIADSSGSPVFPLKTNVDASLNLKANLASPTFTGTVGGITASMVGLGSVDNTSDSSKPVSTFQQTALNLKANLEGPTFTGTVRVSSLTSGVVHTDTSGNLASSLIVTADITNANVTSDKLALDISYNGILKVVDCSGGSVNQVANKGYVDSQISAGGSSSNFGLVSSFTGLPTTSTLGSMRIDSTNNDLYVFMGGTNNTWAKYTSTGNAGGAYSA